MLNRIEWDADEVLDDVRDYVVGHLGDRDAVLIVDDTGFLKKGVRSAGVQRQYSGTAGRTENSQIGVFLAYATGRGRTLIDRRLYLPTSWTDDRERCRRAGVDDSVAFATKVAMAKAMVRRAIADRIPFGWVTADAAYGYSKGWRFELEQADVFHAMATTRHVEQAVEVPARTPSRCRPASRQGQTGDGTDQVRGVRARGPRLQLPSEDRLKERVQLGRDPGVRRGGRAYDGLAQHGGRRAEKR